MTAFASSPRFRQPAAFARSLLAVAVVLAACGGLATLIDLPVARWISGRTNEATDVEASGSTQPPGLIRVREERRPSGGRRLPGDLVRIVNLAEVFGYSPSAGIILLAALLLDPSLVRRRHVALTGQAAGFPGPASHFTGPSPGRHLAGWLPVSLSPDALRMVAVTFSGGLMTDLIKLVVTRVRPYAAALDLHASAFDTFANIEGASGVAARSFPSGHAAVAAGLASALCWRYPRGTPLFIAIAVAAATQRLTSCSHYVSDVATGGSIAVAWAAFWLWSAKRPNPG